MIASLLIANRGEIACRIIRTARAMGIRTVAVYSDADAGALHVRMADEAVHIGPAPARESYLVGERLIAVAKGAGAEAIHPGYGFLSENAEFAQAVIDAGLIWVGPKPASITAMGLKDAAKQLMAAAGVPVTPGYMGEDQDPACLADEAAKIGYPVLIKAVAGGGGKGMRLVENADLFADALASCQREAASSFGNAHVLIEKYIQRPRHIEVQIFGDSQGNIVHLFERDCSMQRRHQKVIEEAPAPGMDEGTRQQLCAAAVKAARAVDYVGAGTIEFIADASEGLRADRIWFMEMNTRLQVEHPVTEAITGVDLVEWQLRVASGEPLPLRQEQLGIDGHAVEVRIYAEDPGKGFLPVTGTLGPLARIEGHARVDTGVTAGDSISPWYDPMIAKVISRQSTRAAAIADLVDMLGGVVTHPLTSNVPFLIRLLKSPGFSDADLHTGYIEGNLGWLAQDAVPPDALLDAVANALVVQSGGNAASDAIYGTRLEKRANPWQGAIGFRLNRDPQHSVAMTDGEGLFFGAIAPGLADQRVLRDGSAVLAHDAGQSWQFSFGAPRGGGGHAASDGVVLSPMPGRIIAVEVRAGEPVVTGQKLVTLEAMKMEHSLTAPFDGVVAELNAEVGGQVQVEALLVRIEPTA